MATGNILGTFTVELNSEDRERIDRLADALAQLKSLEPTKAVNGFTPVKAEREAYENLGVTQAEETIPEPVEEPEQPTYTAADIQAKVQKLASPACGKRNEVKALVREYAERVSLIPEDKYNEVMQRLTELEEG